MRRQEWGPATPRMRAAPYRPSVGWNIGVISLRLGDGGQVRGASGYVHQDDVLPGTSTVWEFLAFHAALRLPEGHDPAAAGARVRLILRQLSLAKVRTQVCLCNF